MNGVDGGVQIGLPGRHHAGNRPEKHHIPSQESHLPDLTHVGCGRVVAKDPTQVSLYLLLTIYLASIKADQVAASSKQMSKSPGLAIVPAAQDSSI
jgi:hypothetical protein